MGVVHTGNEDLYMGFVLKCIQYWLVFLGEGLGVSLYLCDDFIQKLNAFANNRFIYFVCLLFIVDVIK